MHSSSSIVILLKLFSVHSTEKSFIMMYGWIVFPNDFLNFVLLKRPFGGQLFMSLWLVAYNVTKDLKLNLYLCSSVQTGHQRWWEQEIPIEDNIQKGELLTYNLTELIKPEAYQIRLTPITRFGEGDSADRIIRYSGE